MRLVKCWNQVDFGSSILSIKYARISNLANLYARISNLANLCLVLEIGQARKDNSIVFKFQACEIFRSTSRTSRSVLTSL